MNKRNLLGLLLLIILSGGLQGQTKASRPRVVVGIVVDQMRWDYLKRYESRYGNDGFRRLMREGFSCDNVSIDYVPTVTAIGHASIYTGTVPSIHGIAGNNFRLNNRWVYCTSDASTQTVGSDNNNGRMSPRNLQSTTIGDELRLATNFRSKVISISLKDRAAILPGGHTSNGSFWYDGKTGRFITSSFYMEKLPEWVDRFNRKDQAAMYLNKNWNTLYPIQSYIQSTPDDNDYEDSFEKGQRPVFPIATGELLRKQGYGVICQTPYGNSIVLDMAQAAIDGEKLGQGSETDMLAISLSATDYVGHQFGPNAIETEDTYLRLDKDLAAFFSYMDKKFGKNNYLLFLTADHAGAHNLTFLKEHKLPAGGMDFPTTLARLNKTIGEKLNFGARIIERVDNYQVFLNNSRIDSAGLDRSKIIDLLVDELYSIPGIAYALPLKKAAEAPIPASIKERIINGYNHERSGDIQFIVKPGWYDTYSSTDTRGATHGVWCPYDSHIPLLFMGWKISSGRTTIPLHMTDIAPTITALLGIQQPNGCIGNPIEPVMR